MRDWPVIRFAGLLALFGAETLFLAIRYDLGALRAGATAGGGGAALLGVPRLVAVGIAVVAAVLVTAAPMLVRVVGAHRAAIAAHNPWPFVTAHVAAFAGLLTGTELLWRAGTGGGGGHVGVWGGIWFIAAILVALTWLGAWLPGRVWVAVARRAAVPLLVGAAVGVAAWAAGLYTQNWWRGLRHSTLLSAYVLLRACDASAVVDPGRYLIGSRGFVVEVSSPCSGYEGIGLVWIFLTAHLWFFRERLRFPGALLIPLIATVVVWGANTVRIAVLVLVGAHVSPGLALGGFHSYLGTILFSAVALSVAWTAHRSPWFSKPAGSEAAAGAEENPTAAYLVPFLAAVGLALLTAPFARPGFDPLYAARIVGAGAAVWCYRAAYWRLDWKISPSGAALACLVGAATFGVWMLTATGRRDAVDPRAAAGAWAAAWLVVRCVGAVVVVPVIEELAFRGYLARRVVSAEFEHVPFEKLTWLAVGASSVLFGALHGNVLAGTLAGLAYGWVVRRSGRLVDGIIAHATTNACLTGYVLATGSWGAWG